MKSPPRAFCWFLLGLLAAAGPAGRPRRGRGHDLRIDAGWRSVAEETGPEKFAGCERPGFDDATWSRVDVPHNWDDYGGEHRLVHGNLHGAAWYRREFALDAAERGRRVFLYFEGVGSYATVWLNENRRAGTRVGGRPSRST